MKISLIVAASENNVIGNKGAIPWHLPDDLKFFRTVTKGHPVIMGRKTYESIGQPLPERLNIVVTRNPSYTAEGCTVVTSLPEALALAQKSEQKEAFIIGGGELYKEAISYADRIYITKVHTNVAGDAFFVEIDAKDWHEIGRDPHAADEKHAFPFTILTYEKNL